MENNESQLNNSQFSNIQGQNIVNNQPIEQAQNFTQPNVQPVVQNAMPANMPNTINTQNYNTQNAAQQVLNDMNSVSSKQFTPEELAKINEVSNNINLKDSVSIMSYGSAAQNKMVQFSENTLSNVMNKDLGEVGDAITDVITELKSFDIENETKGKGIFGFFKKATNNLTKLKTKYTNVETNIDNIVKTLEAHQRNLLKDISILDQMYNYNLEYLKELEIYIEAGKQKLNQLTTNEIPALEAKAMASNSTEDAQMARDIKDLANRFEKRIHDLELTKTISIQTIPQIRLVQNNNVIMTEKIQSTITNTIPLWKNQMVLAIGLHHSNEAAKAQRAVTDTTNELLRKNAEMLKTSTIETAKEAERGIVDIETLKHTNQQLISTLDEVMKIQTEGREKRKAAEAELRNIENELKTKILNISKN
ncbi:toxic anion resistance family protein [Brachyspira hampsonii 30446]|uniref:Toxic anion resistance family protein n=1 Tax=Brachyspira hampsonii 30446 TaxID=1289135 RepID=A0A2U4F0E7_9SPIR|nr:toxic anion resistance protein [Brachyspira hampsonii]EKV57632.1 toxic anion resistance family protein [Brachyspira hampsonii 30446]MBW5395124.1 toxic anion resistance protein [Brachyspira hampsonii]OEJ19745.1 toxic anion resistance family protein [Brachyspira hampsonii]